MYKPTVHTEQRPYKTLGIDIVGHVDGAELCMGKRFKCNTTVDSKLDSHVFKSFVRNNYRNTNSLLRVLQGLTISKGEFLS